MKKWVELCLFAVWVLAHKLSIMSNFYIYFACVLVFRQGCIYTNSTGSKSWPEEWKKIILRFWFFFFYIYFFNIFKYIYIYVSNLHIIALDLEVIWEQLKMWTVFVIAWFFLVSSSVPVLINSLNSFYFIRIFLECLHFCFISTIHTKKIQ